MLGVRTYPVSNQTVCICGFVISRILRFHPHLQISNHEEGFWAYLQNLKPDVLTPYKLYNNVEVEHLPLSNAPWYYKG